MDTHETVVSRPYHEEISDRLMRIHRDQATLFRGAAARGVPAELLPKLVADSMNEGACPKIMRGMDMRGGASLILLDGQVSQGDLDVFADDDSTRAL